MSSRERAGLGSFLLLVFFWIDSFIKFVSLGMRHAFRVEM